MANNFVFVVEFASSADVGILGAGKISGDVVSTQLTHSSTGGWHQGQQIIIAISNNRIRPKYNCLLSKQDGFSLEFR